MYFANPDLYNLGQLLSALDGNQRAMWAVLVFNMLGTFGILLVLLLNGYRRGRE